jgi:hypothetical protein
MVYLFIEILYQYKVFTVSLIAHYKLNGDANDASGNGHDGTPTDVSWVAGKIGQAASFNGTTSRIALPLPSAAAGNCTFAAWVYCVSVPHNEYVFDIQTGRTIFAWDYGGKLGFYDGEAAWKTFGNTPSNGAWNHVAWTCDASIPRVTCYLNGVISGSAQSYIPRAVGGLVSLGGHNLLTNQTSTLHGYMDDSRFYNEALPAWRIWDIVYPPNEEADPSQRLILPMVKKLILPTIGATA